MKGWTVTLGVFVAGASVVGAMAINAHVQARDEGMTNALAAAERTPAKPAASQAAPTTVAASAAPVALGAQPAASAAPAVSAAPAAPAPTVAPVAAATKAEPSSVAFKQTTTFNGAPVYVPQGCSGEYDVILHFHGAHPYVREVVEKSGISAVIGVFNAGNGAEKYSQSFQAGGTLSSLLRQVAMAAAPLCGADAKPRRVALPVLSLATRSIACQPP